MEKVALVTGASRGIGKACALRLAECGYDIVVNYNSNEAKAQEVVSAIEALGQKAVAIKANTADLKEVQNMFREAHKAFGRLDVLVNNAGVVDDAFLLMINEDSLTRSLDINIKGYFHCAQQAALKMMSKKQGVIINVSSVSSILAVDGQGRLQRYEGRGQLHDGDTRKGACSPRYPRKRSRSRLHRNRNARRYPRGQEGRIPKGYSDAPPWHREGSR